MAFTPQQLRDAIADWEKKTGKKSPMRIVKPEDSSFLRGAKQVIITESPDKTDKQEESNG
jgi:hypothetical protein